MPNREKRLQRVEQAAAVSQKGFKPGDCSVTPEAALEIYQEITRKAQSDTSPLYFRDGGNFANVFDQPMHKLQQIYREYAQGYIDLYDAHQLQVMGV